MRKVKTSRKGRLPKYCVKASGLAHVLDKSVRVIRSMDYSGKLPRPIRLAGSVVWYLPEIRLWLEAGAPSREEWDNFKKAGKR